MAGKNTGTGKSYVYTAEQLEFIKTAWSDGDSASQIAENFFRQFRVYVSRSAICGKVHRMGLATRPSGGNSSPQATAKRLATAKANGVSWSRKPKPPVLEVPVAPEEPVALGTDTGCKWLHGDDRQTWVYCGHPQQVHSPYCPHHHARAYSKPPPVRQKGHFRSDSVR